MFVFNVGLRYKIIIQYHCIWVYGYGMRWNLDTVVFCAYPACNAKVKLRKMVPKFGLFFVDKNGQNTLYNRARAFKIGE